eukprot:446016-Prorocentrum_minimum.AAC.1
MFYRNKSEDCIYLRAKRVLTHSPRDATLSSTKHTDPPPPSERWCSCLWGVECVLAVIGTEGPAGAAMAEVTLSIHYRAKPGQCMRIVGSSKVLGGWDVSQGVQMVWSKGDVWQVTPPPDPHDPTWAFL